MTGCRSSMSSKTKKPPSFPRRLTALTTFGCHLGRILLRETTLPVWQVGAGVSPTLDAVFKVLLPTEMSRSRCVVSTRQRTQTGKSRQTSSDSEDVFDHKAQWRQKYQAQTLSASCHARQPRVLARVPALIAICDGVGVLLMVFTCLKALTAYLAMSHWRGFGRLQTVHPNPSALTLFVRDSNRRATASAPGSIWPSKLPALT